MLCFKNQKNHYGFLFTFSFRPFFETTRIFTLSLLQQIVNALTIHSNESPRRFLGVMDVLIHVDNVKEVPWSDGCSNSCGHKGLRRGNSLRKIPVLGLLCGRQVSRLQRLRQKVYLYKDFVIKLLYLFFLQYISCGTGFRSGFSIK